MIGDRLIRKIAGRRELAVAATLDDTMPQCTYCKGTAWFRGPEGGVSVNILCANKACRHWFNFTPPLDQLDDLKRVEPTPDEKAREEAIRKSAADAEFIERFEQGAQAYRDGISILALRVTQRAEHWTQERREHIDQICGYIDAMATDIGGRNVGQGTRLPSGLDSPDRNGTE